MPTDGNFPTTKPITSRFVYRNRYGYKEGGWQVGLSAISLPDTHVNLYELVQKDGFILSTSWAPNDYPKSPQGEQRRK